MIITVGSFRRSPCKDFFQDPLLAVPTPIYRFNNIGVQVLGVPRAEADELALPSQIPLVVPASRGAYDNDARVRAGNLHLLRVRIRLVHIVEFFILEASGESALQSNRIIVPEVGGRSVRHFTLLLSKSAMTRRHLKSRCCFCVSNVLTSFQMFKVIVIVCKSELDWITVEMI